MANQSYEQVWETHQELLAKADLLNKALISAIAERDDAQERHQEPSPSQTMPSAGQPDLAQLEGNIDRLRAEKVAAETAVGAHELQVAQENPEHAHWLAEQLPPAPVQVERSSEDTRMPSLQSGSAGPAYLDPGAQRAGLVADVALEIAPSVIEAATDINVHGVLSGPVGELVAKSVEHVMESVDVRRELVNALAETSVNSPAIQEQNTLHHEIARLDVAAEKQRDLEQLDKKHEEQRAGTERTLAEVRAMHEARIERGEVKDPETLRERLEETAKTIRDEQARKQAEEREQREHDALAAREAAERAREEAQRFR